MSVFPLIWKVSTPGTVVLFILADFLSQARALLPPSKPIWEPPRLSVEPEALEQAHHCSVVVASGACFRHRFISTC